MEKGHYTEKEHSMGKRVEEKQVSLEENFTRMENLMEQMEDQEITLEDAFTAYSAGMQILKECNEQIDRVEKKVMKLTTEGRLEEFE